VYEPWRLPKALRADLGYPEPVVALDVARARSHARRGSN
jgi:deoxyribodipyrimidine photo-lyase